MKIIVCLGPVCSGKTTWSKKFIQSNTDWYRFSIDDFRIMGSGFLSNDPALLTSASNAANAFALDLCSEGLNMIVDGYFLNVQQLKRLQEIPEDFKIIVFSCPVSVCMARNIKRNSGSPYKLKQEVVSRFHKQCSSFLMSKDFENFVNVNNIDVEVIKTSKMMTINV